MSDTAYIATPRGPEEVDVDGWAEIFGQRAFLHRNRVEDDDTYRVSEYRTGRLLGKGKSYRKAKANAMQSIRTRARDARKSPEVLFSEAIARQRIINGRAG